MMMITIIVAYVALQVAEVDMMITVVIASLALQVAQADTDDNKDDDDNYDNSGDNYHHRVPGIASCASRR